MIGGTPILGNLYILVGLTSKCPMPRPGSARCSSAPWLNSAWSAAAALKAVVESPHPPERGHGAVKTEGVA